MPKGDFTKTKDFIIPLRGKVSGGKLVALLDQNGAEIGMPVTASESVTGGIEILGPGGDAVIVIEAAAPDDEDGRADGVIYIQTEA